MPRIPRGAGDVSGRVIRGAMAAQKEISTEHTVEIRPVGLVGDLVVPADARGIVLFAHGSGSSRFSSRNRFVAGVLQNAGFGTLLLDLLTAGEEQLDLRTRHLRFDIGLLAERLGLAAEWLRNDTAAARLPLCYFGASTGAAAALVAATNSAEPVQAIVSRGGRPDLAGAALAQVASPTLLIVGGDDKKVLELNQRALAELQCEKKLVVVPGATHLFEEPGTLETAAELARGWFQQHIPL